MVSVKNATILFQPFIKKFPMLVHRSEKNWGMPAKNSQTLFYADGMVSVKNVTKASITG